MHEWERVHGLLFTVTLKVKDFQLQMVMYDLFYTVSQKTRHLTLAHNFTKYWPIFKILSLLDSVGNL